MWLDIRVRLCGWTKSLLTSCVGVCVILSIHDCGRVVVVGLPVLKRRDLGLGDPKLSLLRLWGQSSCCFQLLNYTSSSVLRTPSSIHLYATKSLLKDALSLVSLVGDNGTSNDRCDNDDVQNNTKLKVCFNLHYWIDANVLSCKRHKCITPYTTFTMKWIAMTKEKSKLQETGTSSVSTETSASLQRQRRWNFAWTVSP